MGFINKFIINHTPNNIIIDLNEEKSRILIINLLKELNKESKSGGGNSNTDIYNSPTSILGPTPDNVILFIDTIIDVLKLIEDYKLKTKKVSKLSLSPKLKKKPIEFIDALIDIFKQLNLLKLTINSKMFFIDTTNISEISKTNESKWVKILNYLLNLADKHVYIPDDTPETTLSKSFKNLKRIKRKKKLFNNTTQFLYLDEDYSKRLLTLIEKNIDSNLNKSIKRNKIPLGKHNVNKTDIIKFLKELILNMNYRDGSYVLSFL